MKLKNYKGLLLALFMFVGANSFAQKKVFFFETKEISIGAFTNIKELEGKNKGELIKMYLERLKVMNAVFPVIAFTKDPNKTCEDLGIPSDKISRLDEENKRRFEAGQSQEVFLKEFLSFADKSDISKGILLMEEVLKFYQQSKSN